MQRHSTSHPISLSDFAKAYGVTVGAVTNWRSRLPDFPNPIDASAKRAQYDLHELLAWCRAHSRVPTSQSKAELSLLFHIALPEKDSKDPARDAVDALAIAAVELLRCVSPDEVDEPDPLLQPALTLLPTCDPEVLEQVRRVLRERAAASLPELIDELRTDYAALADEYAWAERTAVADVVAVLAEPAPSVVDPCCGNGSLLEAVARLATGPVRLTGLEYDPVRAASAYALLRCEGRDVTIKVGDSFAAADQLNGHDLVVASPPVGAAQQKTPNGMDEWVHLCTTEAWTRHVQQSVVLVPTSWVLHPQPVPDGRGGDLVQNPSLTAAVTLSPGPAQRRQSITILGYQDVDRQQLDQVLLVDASGVADREALRRVTAAVQRLRTYEPGETQKVSGTGRSVAPGARLVGRAELLERGTVAPESYTRTSQARDQSARLAEVPDLPTLAFDDLRASLSGRRRSALRPADKDAPDLGTLVSSGLLEFGDPADLESGNSAVVTIGTTSANFGQISLLRPGAHAPTTGRRGLVGLRISPAGTASGLSAEFLAAWLASAPVQSLIERMVATGKVRRSLSRSDLLSLPADFPDQRRQEHAATRWEEFEELTTFELRLRQALSVWKLRLLDEPDAAPPTED